MITVSSVLFLQPFQIGELMGIIIVNKLSILSRWSQQFNQPLLRQILQLSLKLLLLIETNRWVMLLLNRCKLLRFLLLFACGKIGSIFIDGEFAVLDGTLIEKRRVIILTRSINLLKFIDKHFLIVGQLCDCFLQTLYLLIFLLANRNFRGKFFPDFEQLVFRDIVGWWLIQLRLISAAGIARSHISDKLFPFIVHTCPQLVKFIVYLLLELLVWSLLMILHTVNKSITNFVIEIKTEEFFSYHLQAFLLEIMPR